MKKIICILTILAMTFSLVSCKESNAKNRDTSSEAVNVSSDNLESETQSEKPTTDAESENSDVEDTSSKQHTSSSSDTSSNVETDEPPKTLKPYDGKLPSITLGKIPQFAERKFEISGFWAPYDISEEGLKQYKDAGFTTLAMINHSLTNTSEDQFYLGSKRTMQALQNCKKVGLKAILNYNDWKAEQCEGAGYNGETPFSKYDLYKEYKDIITGIHICDEPYKDRHFPLYGKPALVEDFKKIYPNAKFIVNLIPYTAFASRGFNSYDEMMELYEKTFMQPFENPFVSVDVYPFHEGSSNDDGTLALNYEYIANSAKKFGVKPGFILQSSVGGGEFEMALSEGDLRWEINSALAFGADMLQYYCYSVPKTIHEDGKVTYMYDYCILNRDDTPSPIYYHLQKLHKEIQSFSNIILTYDWEETIGVLGDGDYVGRVSNLAYNENFEKRTFIDPKHFVGVTSTEELIISRFTNEQYGEAYMFVNFADRKDSSVTATFRDCKAVAVYNSKTGSTPKIINLDKNNQVTLPLAYGEGLFVIPLV